MNRPIIACDVDEVCADLLTEWLRRYSLQSGERIMPEDLDGWHLDKQVKHPDILWDCLKSPEIYNFVTPIPGARQTVEALRKLGRVVFVSSCYPGSESHKLRWLKTWGFLDGDPAETKKHKDFVSCLDKSLIRADVLLDDCADNVDAFNGRAWLIAQPHNRYTPSRRARVLFKDTPELVRFFLTAI